MQLQHVMGARLSLDSGEEVMLERIGKGMFHTCYVDRSAKQVYSITIERESGSDYSKEILSKCDANPHIPQVNYIGGFAADDRRVYRMPLYLPLRAAANRDAWELLKRLMQAKTDAWEAVRKEQGIAQWGVKPKMRIEDIGHLVNDRVIALMNAPGVPQSLKDALQELSDTAGNYGADYVFEFSRKNCLVDGAGTLILLDVLFSLETVERMRTAARRKHGSIPMATERMVL